MRGVHVRETTIIADYGLATGECQEYTWDHRNRLVQIQVRDAQGTLLRDIQYVYDVFDRRIAKAVDPDGGQRGKSPAVSGHYGDGNGRWTSLTRRAGLLRVAMVAPVGRPSTCGGNSVSDWSDEQDGRTCGRHPAGGQW